MSTAQKSQFGSQQSPHQGSVRGTRVPFIWSLPRLAGKIPFLQGPERELVPGFEAQNGPVGSWWDSVYPVG